MKCFEIDFNHILQISMLNRENLIIPRLHCSRRISEYILYIILNGHLELLMDDEVITLVPGDIYLFDRNRFQKPVRSTNCEFFYIHFETDACTELHLSEQDYVQAVQQNKTDFWKTNVYGTQGYRYMRVLLKQKTQVSKGFLDYLVNTLENNIITYENNDLQRRMNISNTVAGILMRIEATAIEGGTQTGRRGRVYHTVRRITDYIRENYLLPFDSQDIEKALLINFDYANRIFKKQMGYSIIRYRNILRINTAKSMMLSTDQTLGEIAEKTGFRDLYYFSRYFKTIEGISPSEYREQVLKDQERKEYEKDYSI